MQAQELKEWRQGNKLSLERIAYATGVGRETVRNWERGLVFIPDEAEAVIRKMMSGEFKFPSKPVNLAGVSDLELIQELEYRARQREAGVKNIY